VLEPALQRKRRWYHPEDILLLVLLGALFYLPALSRIPLFDRDEPRFAVAARTMLDTGDYIVPRYNGNLRPDKPPLVYWLMDAGYQISETLRASPELGARLPSAVCGTLALIVIYFMTGSRFGRLTGFVAAMMAGSCTLYVVIARFATADGTMLLFITSCMALAWRAWDAVPRTAGTPEARMPRADYLLDRTSERSPLMLDHLPETSARKVPVGIALLFWISLAAGTLTKGVPLAFVLIPMLVLSLTTGALPGQLRQWRSHFHFTSWRVAVALLIAAGVTGYFVAAPRMGWPDIRTWVALLGILLVGMIVTPGLPGVLVRCLWHGNWAWWKQLRPLVGIPLLIALVGWWVLLAGQATHWKLIEDMVGTHFLARIGVPTPDATTGGTQSSMKSYSQPPGFYLVTVWGTFWPWSILLVPAAYHTWRRLRGKLPVPIDRRPYQFLVAWILPMWIALEASRGKLFHYPLPLYVPIAILCADTLVQSWNRMTDVLAAPWISSMRWIVLVIWCALGIGLLLASKMHPDPNFMWRCFPLAIALMGTGFVSAVTWGRPSWPYVVTLSWGGSLLMASTLLLADLPELQVSRVASQMMRDARSKDSRTQLGVCGYEDATIVFYSKIPPDQHLERFSSADDLAKRVPFDADAARTPWVIVVDEKARKRLDELKVRYARLPRLDAPENLAAFDINGIVAGNIRKLANISVITNVVPEPATTAATTPKPQPEAP
jgi:4-amino-4-deoxy-L-arabinose transferase-like glycosyltransferase